MVVKLCTCLLCVFSSILSWLSRFGFEFLIFRFFFLHLHRVACTIYEHKPNAKWYFETLSKKVRRRRRWQQQQQHLYQRWRKRHTNLSVFFFFIHALISSLVRFCYDCFLGDCWTARYSSPYWVVVVVVLHIHFFSRFVRYISRCCHIFFSFNVCVFVLCSFVYLTAHSKLKEEKRKKNISKKK